MNNMLEVGGQEGYFWGNQSWVFSSSDNSGGGGGTKGDEKLLGSASNSQTGTGPSSRPQLAVAEKSRQRNGKESVEGSEDKDRDCNESDHEVHIWTERERRKRMRSMFSNLHSLLPQLPPKADKSTIVDEAVSYIKTLEQTLQTLKNKKLEKCQAGANYHDPSLMMVSPSQPAPKMASFQSREAFLADQGSSDTQLQGGAINAAAATNSPNYRFPAAVTFQTWTSSNVVLNMCGDNAQINVCTPRKLGMFTAICYVLEKHKLEVVTAHVSSDQHRSMYMIQCHAIRIADHEQFLDPFPVEERYKQAAGEITLWLST